MVLHKAPVAAVVADDITDAVPNSTDTSIVARDAPIATPLGGGEPKFNQLMRN